MRREGKGRKGRKGKEREGKGKEGKVEPRKAEHQKAKAEVGGNIKLSFQYKSQNTYITEPV